MIWLIKKKNKSPKLPYHIKPDGQKYFIIFIPLPFLLVSKYNGVVAKPPPITTILNLLIKFYV